MHLRLWPILAWAVHYRLAWSAKEPALTKETAVFQTILRLRKCTTHQTATGTVRLCAEHDAQLSSDAPPAWRDALGLAQYHGVSRGYSSHVLCDACAHEALAKVGLTRADVIMQPYDDDRRLVQLIAA